MLVAAQAQAAQAAQAHAQVQMSADQGFRIQVNSLDIFVLRMFSNIHNHILTTASSLFIIIIFFSPIINNLVNSINKMNG